MKAVVLTGSGAELREVETPEPRPAEVLIRVRAASLNRADLTMAAGHRHGYLGAAGSVAGMEFAGEVAACGSAASGFKAGDRVMCSGSGAFAEYAVADYGRTTRIPASMSFVTAASLPVGLHTLHNALMTVGKMQPGEAVLIQGASSSVGLMGLQIAKLKGARLVVGTSTRAEKRARLKDFGADLAVDSRDPTWVDQVVEATGGKGVDLIVDMLSGYVANANMHACRVLGRIVNIGRMGGMTGDFDFDLHSRKRIQYLGASFRSRTVEEIRAIYDAFRADIWADVEAGRLRMPVDRTFPLAEFAAAMAHVKANAHFGKIVLEI